VPENVISSAKLPGDLVRHLSTSAGYHGPQAYAASLQPSKSVGGIPGFLTYHRDLSITADPAADGFIPLSSVSGRGRNTKLFAVGILPPNMMIDPSLVLDRSATAPGLARAAADAQRVITFEDDQELLRPTKISAAGKGAIEKFEGSVPTAYRDSGGVLTIGIGHTGPEVTPDLVWTQAQIDQQFNIDIARFEATVAAAVTVPVTQGQFDAMVSLAFNIGETAFRNSTLVQKLNAGDVAGASAEFPAWRMVKGNVSGVLVARRRDERAIFDAASPPLDQPLPVTSDAQEATFAGYGASNANSFRQNLARQTDLKPTALQVKQTGYFKSIKATLDSMAGTPPLRLLVNPNSFSVKSQKIVSDGNWGRSGPIIEFWGDDQDKISGSGKVAAFYALDANPRLGRGGPGLSRGARNVSLAWQNFQSLYLLYRNNGGLYTAEMNQQDRDILLTTVGSVYLFYDNILYIGCFDSLSITESDQQPFTVEYSFEFTVRAAFLLDFAQDFTYGGAPAFSRSTLGAGLPVQSANV